MYCNIVACGASFEWTRWPNCRLCSRLCWGQRCDRFDGPSNQTRTCICKAAISDPDGIRHIAEADAARGLASARRANADCRRGALATTLETKSMPAEVYRAALALLLVPFVTNAFGMWVAWLATFRMRQINAGGPAANEESADRRSGYWLRLGLAYFQTFLWVAMALAVARITTAATGPRSVLIMWATLVVLAIMVRLRPETSVTNGPG